MSVADLQALYEDIHGQWLRGTAGAYAAFLKSGDVDEYYRAVEPWDQWLHKCVAGIKPGLH